MFQTLSKLALLLSIVVMGSAAESLAQDLDALKVIGIISLPAKGVAETGVAVLKDRTGKSIIAKVGRKIPGHPDLTLTNITGKSVKVRSGSGPEQSLAWQSGEPTLATTSRVATNYEFSDPEPILDEEIEEFMEEVPLEPQGEKEPLIQMNIDNKDKLQLKEPEERAKAAEYWEREINRPAPSESDTRTQRKYMQMPTRSFMDLNRKPLRTTKPDSN